MNENIKIGILGGDMRQLLVAAMFAEAGIESATWGICPADKLSGKYKEKMMCYSVKCTDWRGALNGAAAVILPLPLTTDGVRLNCKGADELSPGSYDVRLTEIIEKAGRNTIIFAGKIPLSIMRFAGEHNVKMIDYYEFEEFQIKNAVPTAEGAISIAMNELPVTLADSSAAVVGYGRIGRTLAQKLKALGADVSCIARSKKDLSWSVCDGCKPVFLEDYKKSPSEFDIIFNTVPHIVFDEKTISKLSKDSIIVDLASMNGGVDVTAAQKNEVRVIKALSLPGKSSPKTAGKIIFDTVTGIMKEEKLL